MQKRTLYSLLLTSFILVCAFSLSSAQEVTIESATLQRCVTDTLDVTITNPSDISAYEIVLGITGDISVVQVLHSEPANWDVSVTPTGPDVVRFMGMMLDPAASCLAAGGPTLVAQLVITTDNVCSGTATVDGTTYSCPTTPVTAQTHFIDCATTTVVAAAVNAGTVTINNLPPVITCPPNDSIHWGTTYLGQATATDPDLVNGCEKLTFTKLSGPVNLTVAGNGAISWPTSASSRASGFRRTFRRAGPWIRRFRLDTTVTASTRMHY